MPVSTRRTRRISRLPLPTELFNQILEDNELSPLDVASCCFVNRLFRSIALPLLNLEEDIELKLLTAKKVDGRDWYFNEYSDSILKVLEKFPPLAQLVTSASLSRCYSELLRQRFKLPNKKSKNLTEREREKVDIYAEAVEAARSNEELKNTIPAKDSVKWNMGDAVEWCLELMPNLRYFQFGEDVWDDRVGDMITDNEPYRSYWQTEERWRGMVGVPIVRRCDQVQIDWYE